jgi:hypothetical protein
MMNGLGIMSKLLCDIHGGEFDTTELRYGTLKVVGLRRVWTICGDCIGLAWKVDTYWAKELPKSRKKHKKKRHVK